MGRGFLPFNGLWVKIRRCLAQRGLKCVILWKSPALDFLPVLDSGMNVDGRTVGLLTVELLVSRWWS